MNLDVNPTKEELSALFASCNDEEGHHILWVNREGNVSIDLLKGTNPAYWAKERQDVIQFRLETWIAGNGYTGAQAATNQQWIDRIYKSITMHWSKKTKGYIDVF